MRTVARTDLFPELGTVPQADQAAAASPALPAPPSAQQLAEAALAAGLSVRSDVAQRLARQRTALLAEAWTDSLRQQLPPPSVQAIEAVYAASPALYAQRRVYRLLQVTVADAMLARPDCRAALADSATLWQWLVELQALDIHCHVQTLQHASEDLPDLLLRPLHNAVAGQRFRVQQGRRTSVYELLSVRQSPRSLTQAAPEIAAQLQAQQLEAWLALSVAPGPASATDAPDAAAAARPRVPAAVHELLFAAGCQ